MQAFHADVPRIEIEVDVSAAVALAGSHRVALRVFLPPPGQPTTGILLYCLPGGALSQAYFDLPVTADESYSFARSMARAGNLVVTADHLGTGASSVPDDGFALRIEDVVAANEAALQHLLTKVRDGSLDLRLPPCTAIRVVGVGHSMGGLLTVLQQSAFASHDALILLGYSNAGMREALPPAALALIDDSGAARAALNELVRDWLPAPFVELPDTTESRAIYQGGGIPEPAVRALIATQTRLLGIGGLLSMIPASATPELALLQAPVFLALGDRDIAGCPQEIPASLPACPYLTLIVLADTGHNHFLYSSRRRLMQLVQHWLHSLSILNPEPYR